MQNIYITLQLKQQQKLSFYVFQLKSWKTFMLKDAW